MQQWVKQTAQFLLAFHLLLLSFIDIFSSVPCNVKNDFSVSFLTLVLENAIRKQLTRSCQYFVSYDVCTPKKNFFNTQRLFLNFSTIALCKLIEHSIASNDLRLQEIHVKGEQIFSKSDGVRTRSKAAEGMHLSA